MRVSQALQNYSYILQNLEIQEIRLLLQAAAESTLSSDESEELETLSGMLKLINDKYPLNKHEESPTVGDETFRKRTAEEW